MSIITVNATAKGLSLVEIATNQGSIIIELNQKKAPKTVKNFLRYVDEGAYDGTIFHRVIDNFMIQGGGFDPNMKRKETFKPIKNESNNDQPIAVIALGSITI